MLFLDVSNDSKKKFPLEIEGIYSTYFINFSEDFFANGLSSDHLSRKRHMVKHVCINVRYVKSAISISHFSGLVKKAKTSKCHCHLPFLFQKSSLFVLNKISILHQYPFSLTQRVQHFYIYNLDP